MYFLLGLRSLFVLFAVKMLLLLLLLLLGGFELLLMFMANVGDPGKIKITAKGQGDKEEYKPLESLKN